ncbi:hypothetical protein [Lyngbya aestuarii]|uniref:hypothetical protein n=1 Tax=Lyngbya aestuarii TaxID=118322 RepID=UPI00403D8B7A
MSRMRNNFKEAEAKYKRFLQRVLMSASLGLLLTGLTVAAVFFAQLVMKRKKPNGKPGLKPSAPGKIL